MRGAFAFDADDARADARPQVERPQRLAAYCRTAAYREPLGVNVQKFCGLFGGIGFDLLRQHTPQRCQRVCTQPPEELPPEHRRQ